MIGRRACLSLAVLAGTVAILVPATADDNVQMVGGLSVYLGVLPAALVRGHPVEHPERTMHGGVPGGRHDYHLLAAIFDATSGARVSDAEVSATVAGLGLAGERQRLEPMRIADTVTYGAFFTLPGADRYTVKLEIRRPGAASATVVEFTYRHSLE